MSLPTVSQFGTPLQPLQEDPLSHAFSFLSLGDAATARSVCKKWRLADSNARAAQMDLAPSESAFGRRVSTLRSRREIPSLFFEKTVIPACSAVSCMRYFVLPRDWADAKVDSMAQVASLGAETANRVWTVTCNRILLRFAAMIGTQLPSLMDNIKVTGPHTDAEEIRSWLKVPSPLLETIRSFDALGSSGIPPEIVYLPNLDSKTIGDCFLKASWQGYMDTIEVMLAHPPFAEALKKGIGRALNCTLERKHSFCAVAILKSDLSRSISQEELCEALTTAAKHGFTSVVQQIFDHPQFKTIGKLQEVLNAASWQAKWHRNWQTLLLIEETKEKFGFSSLFWRFRSEYPTACLLD